MNHLPPAFALLMLSLSGCSTPELPGTSQEEATQEDNVKMDNAPTVLGYTPELRVEMRKLITLQNPSADANKVVSEYMNRLKKMAKASKMEPDDKGNYQLPKEMQDSLNGWRSKGGEQHLPTELKKIASEFDVDFPDWIIPLLNMPKGKELTPQQEELLLLTIGLELMRQLAG